MKKKAIVLDIPNPCSQDWSEMTPTSGGRHCNHCQKTVIDFSTMSDDQLVLFFKRPPTSVCGRVSNEQLSRSIEYEEYHRPPFWPGLVAGISLLLGLSKSAKAQETHEFTRMGDTVLVENLLSAQASIQQQSSDAATTEIDIIGQLVDENKNPLPNARVLLSHEISQKEITMVQTDISGHYKICMSVPFVEGTPLSISFSYAAHDTTVNTIPLQKETSVVNGRLDLSIDAELRTMTCGGIKGMMISNHRYSRWDRLKMKVRRLFR